MIVKTFLIVRHAEIDNMGIVHHSNYPKWFEAARREFLEKSGIPNSKIYALDLFLPLSEMKCHFKSPAKYMDQIIITTKIRFVSYVKLKFEYTVVNKTNSKVIATGTTVHAWTNKSIEPINIKNTAPEIYKKLKMLVEPPSI